MAKISDTTGSSNIWLGSKQNTRQTILYVPASNIAGSGTADKPGLLFLEAVDNAGDIQTGLYLWADSGGSLRFSATYPTNEDGSGTAIGAGGATTTLNNIASVSIPNAGDLLAENDNQVDIGATGTEFKDAWFDGTVTTDDLEADNANFGRTQGSGSDYMKAVAGGTVTLEGSATFDGIGTGLFVSKSAAEVVTGGWDFTTAAVEVKADSLKLGFGNSGVDDSYILFDGTSLSFWDTLTGLKTLAELLTGTELNPTVTGDLTISDGQFDWDNTTAADVNTWTFANTTATVFDVIANSISSGKVLKISSDHTSADAACVYLDVAVGGMDANGNFLACHNGSSDVYEIGKYGAVIAAGSDGGTAVMTFTKGDLVMSDGVINADVDSAIGHNFASSQAGSATSPLITLINSNASYDQPMLYIDAIASGAINAVEIDFIGAAASAIDIGLEAATSDGIKIETTVGSSTGQSLVIDLGTWLGTAGQGAIDIRSDSGGVAEAGHAIYIDLGGTTADAAAISGKGLYIKDAGGAQAGSYLVHLESTNNDALRVAVGEVVLDVDCHVTAGTAAGSTGVDLRFYGDTANRQIYWDSADDQLQFLDGTTTFKFESASTALHVDGSAANDILAIGSNSDTDVEFHGTTGGKDMQWDASDDQLNLLANAELNLDGPIVMSGVQDITDGTAPDIVHPITTLDTDPGGAQATGLANGQEGQLKYIHMTADAGDFVITPTNLQGGATITFDDIGDYAFMIYVGGNWVVVSGTATVAG